MRRLIALIKLKFSFYLRRRFRKIDLQYRNSFCKPIDKKSGILHSHRF